MAVTATRPEGPAEQAELPRRWRLPAEVVLALVTLLGCALRVRQYAFRRSLWGDEASVALNIAHRGFLRLTHPLNILQGAPWGWLWLERVCYLVLGPGEYSLRLPALVGGVLLVVWAALAVRRVLSEWAGIVVVSVIAVAPPLVYYSSEVKPYIFDAAVTVGLLLIAARRDADTGWGIVRFSAAATVGVLLSFPAAMVAGVLAGVMTLVALRHRRFRLVAGWVAGTLPWCAVFAAEYWLSLRPTANSQALKQFWAAGYPAQPLAVSGVLHWLAHDGFSVARYPFSSSVPLLLLLLGLAGVWALSRRSWALAAGCVLVVVATVVVAVARAYPMSDRMDLFAVPLVVLAAGASIDLLRWKVLRVSFAALVVVAWAGIFPRAAVAVAHPYNRTEFRSAVLFAMDHEHPGDTVWIEAWANSIYTYYRPVLHLGVLEEFEFDPSCGVPLAAPAPGSHLWVVWAVPPGIDVNIAAERQDLARVGPELSWKPTSTGAGVAEYQVVRRLPPVLRTAQGCLTVALPPGTVRGLG